MLFPERAARSLAACTIALLLAMSSGCTGRSTPTYATGVGAVVIGVNAYLWRASLDVLKFMPLASADPYGGLIITDWYVPAEKPGERFKAVVYILDRRLRADAVSVAIFRETRTASGWQTATVSDNTAYAIEGAILERARRIYLAREV